MLGGRGGAHTLAYAILPRPLLLLWKRSLPSACQAHALARRGAAADQPCAACPPARRRAADDLTAHVPPASVDACTMIFVLSAIPPGPGQHAALRRVAATLRPGAQLLFRCGSRAGGAADVAGWGAGSRTELLPCSSSSPCLHPAWNQCHA